MEDGATVNDEILAGAASGPGFLDAVAAACATFEVECVGPDGEVKWRDECRNLVTLAGKRLMLDVMFGATAKPSWFVLLKGAGAVASADTLAAHAGWTEVTAYAGSRPGVTFGASGTYSTTGANITHGAAASFAINADNTAIAGCGVCTAATGTAGTLYNAGDFASARTLGNGDTLNVTVTLQQLP